MSVEALPERMRTRRRTRRSWRAIAFALGGAALGLVLALAAPHIVGAVYYLPKLEHLFAELHHDPVLLAALREQNARLADKDEAKIEAWTSAQDQQWLAERQNGGGPLQAELMARPASQHLRDIVAASGGLVSHAFLIDEKGRMAAAPFLSYNFKQTDKPKFHYTFRLGAGARDVSWLQSSWDGTHPVCWRAETMVDPTDGRPIGVVALELDYHSLGHFGCAETPTHTPQERATNHVQP